MLVGGANRDIMEVDTENAPETVGPSNVQLVPSTIDEEIQQVISMFWWQTETLAEQHARLNLQQHIQSTNQNAALMAVHVTR
jgi:hypothetical protein